MIFKLLKKRMIEHGLDTPADFDNFVYLLLRDYGPSLLEMKEQRECKHEFEECWTQYAHTPLQRCKKCGYTIYGEEE